MLFKNIALTEIKSSREYLHVTLGWRKLQNIQLHNVYSSRNIGVIKSRIMWSKHAAHV